MPYRYMPERFGMYFLCGFYSKFRTLYLLHRRQTEPAGRCTPIKKIEVRRKSKKVVE